jgi:2-polyprenyl-3-methyl-5-hydroxy-6-metoxy-1,4-benzoquinol methylase
MDRGRQPLAFEQKYFMNLKYSTKELLIRRHVADVLKWGSRVSGQSLLEGCGKTALDVGCAYGYAVDTLKSFAYEAYGVDISEHAVKKAKTIYLAEYSICDVQNGLPFKSNSFDLLTCFGVLEHLVNPVAALRNMFAACRGTMICTTPNRLVEKPVKKSIRDYDETHINVMAMEEWEKIIEQNLNCQLFKIEPVLDASLRTRGKVLFFKSLKIPYFGLDLRILIKK